MYRHFLNKKDYLSIITETALSQLVRNNEYRFAQAEQAAEATICDYLTENYEIEREFNRGKYIIEYNRAITYPVGAHFYFNGEICEVIKSINGYKAPSDIEYWKICEQEGLDPEDPAIAVYTQMGNYQPKDLVKYDGLIYECLVANGLDFDNIRLPWIKAWEYVPCEPWEKTTYQLWEVVQYEGKFFTLMSLENYEPFTNPMESECWGRIGEYDKTLDTYELSGHDYVVYKDKVYYPVINPNATAPELKVNIRHHDPRNYNLKRYMVQLALYELHKLVSPNNVSTVRENDYDHAILWLRDASRLKLNPQIPRKIGKDNLPVTDWQIATFQTEFNPYNNPWQV